MICVCICVCSCVCSCVTDVNGVLTAYSTAVYRRKNTHLHPTVCNKISSYKNNSSLKLLWSWSKTSTKGSNLIIIISDHHISVDTWCRSEAVPLMINRVNKTGLVKYKEYYIDIIQLENSVRRWSWRTGCVITPWTRGICIELTSENDLIRITLSAI